MAISVSPRRRAGAARAIRNRQTEVLHRVAANVSEMSAAQNTFMSEQQGKFATVEKKLDLFLYSVGQYFIDQQKAKSAPPPDPGYGGNPDQAFGHITYAQHGEDLIFANLFHLLGVKQPSYLDVGAHHPLHISNSALLYARGSSGINVEANPNLIADFIRLRPRDLNLNIGVAPTAGEMEFYCIDERSGRNTFDYQTACDFVRKNPRFQITQTLKLRVMTLNEIVDTYCQGRFPDLLSLDIEGLDLPVIAGVDFAKSSPLVICIELVCGSDQDAGADIAGILREKGYGLYMRTIGNGIFLRNDLLEKLH